MGKRYPFPESIGDIVAEWIEASCVMGPGDVFGQPVVLTAEERLFLRAAYAVDRSTGRRLIDLAAYDRPKGARKSELLSWVTLAEAVGPVRARMVDGKPVVGPVTDPYIPVVATTEDQADRTMFATLRTIIAASPQLEPLFELGMDKIVSTSGPGLIELVASGKPGALDGAKPTFTAVDESHLMVGPTLLEAAAVLKRNLRKRAMAQPWLMTASTAYRAGQKSMLESLHEQAGLHGSGSKRVGRLLYDRKQASESHDLTTRDGLLAAIQEAGGDAYWRDAEQIAEAYADPSQTETEFRRYWLGQILSANDAFIQAKDWRACEVADLTPLAAGDRITLGFDGSLTGDHTALVAVRLSDQGVFLLGHWVPPEDSPDGQKGMVDIASIDSFVRDVFDRFDVVRMKADPAYWQDVIAGWQADFGGERVRAQYATAYAQMDRAFTTFRTAVRAQVLKHDGNPVLAKHVANGVEARRNQLTTVRKSTPWSADKIDALMAAVLAWQAHTEAVADGALAVGEQYEVFTF